MGQILTFIDIVLSAYSIYENSQKTDTDIVQFLKKLKHLLKQLKFCKEVHDAFQDLQTTDWDRFMKGPGDIKHGRRRDIDEAKEGWQKVRDFYIKRIEDLENDLPQLDEDIRKIETSNTIALTVEKNINIVNKQYPELLKSIRKFIEIYKEQNQKIMVDEAFSNFEINNTDITSEIKSILGRADKMILNLVPILTYSYDKIIGE